MQNILSISGKLNTKTTRWHILCLISLFSAWYRFSFSVVQSVETWPSGWRRAPAKGVYGEPYRGFESLRLRHIIYIIHCYCCYFFREKLMAPTLVPSFALSEAHFSNAFLQKITLHRSQWALVAITALSDLRYSVSFKLIWITYSSRHLHSPLLLILISKVSTNLGASQGE